MSQGQPNSIPGQPLTAAHYDALISAERTYHDLLPEIDKAMECGVPCDDVKRDAHRGYARVRKFLASYFPNGRPES